MREIVLPETKPALEWINGRVVQKVSPQRKHSLAQAVFAAALLEWARAGGRGDVGTEWEFRVAPPGEDRRPLVPDVAFLSFDRLPYEDEDAADIPRVSPTVAIEIISPGDRRSDIDEKIRVYIAAGTSAVVMVDTKRREVDLFDLHGRRGFEESDTLTHESLPGFAMPVRLLFERPRPKR